MENKSRSPFTRIAEPDIHTIRRVQIIKKHPEIKNLMGHDKWGGFLTLLVVVGQLVLAFFISKYWFNWQYGILFVLSSYIIGGLMNHWVGMAIHEASHDLLAPNTVQNKVLSIVANIPILLPVAVAFRRHHLKHHSHLGIEEKDNDFPSHFEAKNIGNSPVRKFLWLFFYVFFITLARGFTVKPSRWEWANIAFIAITDGLILYFMGWGAVFYLLLSTFWGYSLHPVAGHFIHEHFIFTEHQETNSYYGILNRVCFNVGYHNEHHDFMNIPGRFLPKYLEITKPFYENLSSTKSWTMMFVDFIFSKKIGAESRYTRDEKTRLHGIEIAKSLSKE